MRQPHRDPYDYVIVGAGAAGCVLAGRLSEDPGCRVLLLEAGGADRGLQVRVPAAFTKLFKTACDWNLETEPQSALRQRRLYWPRGRMLGGSTSLNAQMYVRGHPADYDGWAGRGNRGWAFDDVLPYFMRAERMRNGVAGLHGAGGPLHVEDLRDPNPMTSVFLQAAVASGLPLLDGPNDGGREGVGPTKVTQRRGRRWSAADAYLRPARRRTNLTILTNAHVTHVMIDGRRAVGVRYARDGERRLARARREVIVAAGAVHSPSLLMRSGVGAAAHLRAHGIEVVHDLPGVGQNLHDHLAVAVIVGCREPVSLVAAESLRNLARFLLLRRGMLTSNVAEACAFVRTRTDVAVPDLELIFAPVPFIGHGLVEPPGHGLTIGAVCLQPRSTGSVALRSADPFAPPAIEPRYLSDPGDADLRVLVEGVRLARRIFAADAFSRYAGDELEPGRGVQADAEIGDFIRDHAETLYHPVGTCRMGDDAGAVVDAALRVHGITALRVVDASVMPTIVRGHTAAPTIMIAERAADLIRQGAAPPAGVPSFMDVSTLRPPADDRRTS
jgi:choline dehydrogenase